MRNPEASSLCAHGFLITGTPRVAVSTLSDVTVVGGIGCCPGRAFHLGAARRASFRDKSTLKHSTESVKHP